MQTKQEEKLRGLSMNVVYQIGDALDEQLKAGKDFVSARQGTNDTAIDFASKLVAEYAEEIRKEAIEGYMKDMIEALDNNRQEHPADKAVIPILKDFLFKSAEAFLNQSKESFNSKPDDK